MSFCDGSARGWKQHQKECTVTTSCKYVLNVWIVLATGLFVSSEAWQSSLEPLQYWLREKLAATAKGCNRSTEEQRSSDGMCMNSSGSSSPVNNTSDELLQ